MRGEGGSLLGDMVAGVYAKLSPRPVIVSDDAIERGWNVCVDAETYGSLTIPESQRYSERMKDKRVEKKRNGRK